MGNSQERFCEVHKKRSTLGWLIFVCIIVMIIGGLLTKFAVFLGAECDEKVFRHICFSNPGFIEMIGQCLIIYSGLCALILGVTLLRPACIFYCTKEGFWSQKFGFVKWIDVKEISPDNSNGQTNICYQIKDSDKEYVLKFQGLDVDVDDIFKLMKTYYKDV